MPIRAHFGAPLADRRSWNGFHKQWPLVILVGLNL